MKVIFINHRSDRERVIGEVENFNKALDVIESFLVEHNFESHYYRYWQNEERNGVMVDVGSHSEFFLVEGATLVELRGF